MLNIVKEPYKCSNLHFFLHYFLGAKYTNNQGTEGDPYTGQP